jgi:hypothetical protein
MWQGREEKKRASMPDVYAKGKRKRRKEALLPKTYKSIRNGILMTSLL